MAHEDDEDQLPLPRWARKLAQVFPFLVQECPFGRKHWAWHQLCACGVAHIIPGQWSGGMCDLSTGMELHIGSGFVDEDDTWLPQEESDDHGEDYEAEEDLEPDYLTPEEEHIIHAWRDYKVDMLEKVYGTRHSYKYEVAVTTNGVTTVILTGVRGLRSLDDEGPGHIFGRPLTLDDKPN